VSPGEGRASVVGKICETDRFEVRNERVREFRLMIVVRDSKR